MKSYNSVFQLLDLKSTSCLCSLFVIMSLICGAYFIGSAWLGKDTFWLSPGLGTNSAQKYTDSVKSELQTSTTFDNGRGITHVEKCNDKCRPVGSETLPKGILSTISNLEMSSLWGPISNDKNSRRTISLLALAVGIKQKSLVNAIVKKFLGDDFVVMLFHYDGIVDEWRDLEWNDRVIHVSAKKQTKWWFAKRFLHPDIVAEYEYIFLWDEDLGVENFHPIRYISIVKEEGLEISQPALDHRKSEVHHLITVRNPRSRVHRRYYRVRGGGSGRCDDNSTTPPCVGWNISKVFADVVECRVLQLGGNDGSCVLESSLGMRLVYDPAVIHFPFVETHHECPRQNDLVHAWGLDMKLGYCAQGDPTVKVGVVDEEYIVHLGVPILGNHPDKKAKSALAMDENRVSIRLRSYAEMKALRSRWDKAMKEDQCWVDPFQQPLEQHY